MRFFETVFWWSWSWNSGLDYKTDWNYNWTTITEITLRRRLPGLWACAAPVESTRLAVHSVVSVDALTASTPDRAASDQWLIASRQECRQWPRLALHYTSCRKDWRPSLVSQSAGPHHIAVVTKSAQHRPPSRGSIQLFTARCRWPLYSVSQTKSTSSRFSFFHKRLRIFNRFFTHLLHVSMHARLQIFIQLSAMLTKLCHIKRDYLVHLIYANVQNAPKRARSYVCVSRW